ncbi:uncharacterized protein I206_100817 [Kwoniella pini CBS 10737]|uniref:PHD-type domain-containing protein n=1 Tax=Kwoniella pini CBS 10737 TaxID=1296096 RepID=A0A1B9IC69_9TREE|nr:uncharacterized protein I206_00510 [Kwoniella pini CBS 10737]OCF53209.1 hypothetical protein I206_00510 [Kwoniella pini CBS 10737]
MHSSSHGQELMTDWTPTLSSFGNGIRREKDSLSAVASPTYSHLSTAESQLHSPAAQQSPYPHGQTLVLNGPAPSYHHPYPTLSGSHLQPMTVQLSSRLSPLGQSTTYYPTPQAEYDVFQTPSRPGTAGGQVSPDPYLDQASFTTQHSNAYDGTTPLLTTTTLSRSYDSTIPSYYQTSTDGRRAWSQATPDKQPTASKRKRERHTSKETPAKALKTPNRSKQQQQQDENSGGRSSKRVRVESAPTPTVQLPTPPSSGKEVSIINLPPHIHLPIMHEDNMTPIEEEPEVADSSARRGLVITRHHEEGRKLGLFGISQGELEETSTSNDHNLSPRTTTIPALTTDESGLASLSTNEVLESEVAWFEDRARGQRSPPSSPDLVTLRTPTMSHDRSLPDDYDDSPEAQAQRIAKRLQAFSDNNIQEEQPLISTRIDLFGRVAVRKATAMKFLGLDRSTSLTEETRNEDEDNWTARPVASSSKVVLKPLWPDEEAPWALAGGSKKEKMRKEESEKATLLKRYLETSSDDSGSDEEGLMTMYTTYGKGKGKSVSRLMSSSSSSTGSSNRVSRKRRSVGPDGVDANARSALLVSLRSRAVPVLPAGVVACVCGTSNTSGMGSMISCAACKTWHHIMCCGIEDESKIGSNWWCNSCENSSRSIIHTPSSHSVAHSTPRGRYSQLADPRSSAVKSDIGHIALAPSPMFVNSAHHSLASSGPGVTSTRTPITRVVSSPKRPERARMLSYGSDMWAFAEADGNAPPSTPAPIMGDRYSTPRIDDAPFDVTSTPSRHLDFNFGQPSLFSLTPLGGQGRSRVPSSMLIDGTPIRGISVARNISFSGPIIGSAPPGESIGTAISRSDFFKDMNKSTPGVREREENFPPVSPRWPVGLLGAHNLSPSPFAHGHKRNLSGNKLSSMRSSSRTGNSSTPTGLMGIGLLAEEKDEE